MNTRLFVTSVLTMCALALSGCGLGEPRELTIQDAEVEGRFTVPRDAQNVHFSIGDEPTEVFARFTINQEDTQEFIDSLGINNQIISYFGQKNPVIDTTLEEAWWQPVRLYEKKIISKNDSGFSWNIVLGKTVDETAQNQITIYIYNFEE